MRRTVILFLCAISVTGVLTAQNVGVGTITPAEKFTVWGGNFLVQQPYAGTSAPPAPAQTVTMVNGNTTTFAATDSTGRIYDPGGPSGNYIDNLNTTVNIPNDFNSIGIEITIESMQINTGDSLIISNAGGYLIKAWGNNNNVTGVFLLSTIGMSIKFKSNIDGQNGTGFSLLFKKLYAQNASPLKTGVGNALFFDATKGAFNAGVQKPDNNLVGNYSASFGLATASGEYSFAANAADATGNSATAFGNQTKASGFNATAIGYSTIASGSVSTAIGSNNKAAGNTSTAIGFDNLIEGEYAIGLGRSNSVTGNSATALGYGNVASGMNAVAIGNANYAIGSSSSAMGVQTTASGSNSTTSGQETQATGPNATASGKNTIASGPISTTMGSYTKATGIVATAMGTGTTAMGTGSTAIGGNTLAAGDYSLAAGSFTKATGYESAAFGAYSIANGTLSTAIGDELIANGYASLVIGTYNDTVVASQFSWQNNTPLFIIGNGLFSRHNALVVQADGKMGLGINTPAATLDVKKTGADALVYFRGTQHYAHFMFGANEDTYIRGGLSSSKVVIGDLNNEVIVGIGGSLPGDKFTVNGNTRIIGNLCYTGAITACSDVRYKTNFSSLKNPIQKIQQLHAIYYNWKQGDFPQMGFTGERQLGLSAQEVEKILPEIVQTNALGYKSVDYSRLTPLLIEGAKMQQQQIVQLQRENSDLKTRLDKLEQRLSNH
jgi:hypothetical protein